jgi:DUF4097 and DUF4098 domain-containing protein YvlB
MKPRAIDAVLTAVLAGILIVMGAAAAAPGPASREAKLLGDAGRNVQTKNMNVSAAARPGQSLRVDLAQAHLTIAAWDKNEVAAEATVEVGDSNAEFIKEFLEATTLTLAPEAGGLVLRLTSPMDRRETDASGASKKIAEAIRRGRWNISFAARITVRVPASQDLDVKTAFGDVAVSGVSGRLNLHNESGEVRADGCGGELNLENSFGAVRVSDFKGPAVIRNESGEVRAERISGRVDIKNSFNRVVVSKIGGPLDISSESAEVTGADVTGDCMIKSSFNPIEVRGVSGRLDVTGESSAVTIDGAGKDVVVTSSFNPVRVTNVKGGLRATCESAAVTAESIGGDAWVTTSFNPVEARRIRGGLSVKAESSGVLAEDVDGAIDVRNSFMDVIVRRSSGSITIRSESGGVEVGEIKALPAGSVIEIKNTFNPITLTLPAGTEVQGTAKTDFGKISSDFPVILKDGMSFGQQAVTFESARPGVTVRLEGSADIKIRREKI